MTDDKMWDMFFNWLDSNMETVHTPAVGDLPSSTIKPSDYLASLRIYSTKELSFYLCDALFEEYVKEQGYIEQDDTYIKRSPTE